MAMIFDTHAHYDDPQFDEDREEILASLTADGIGTVVNVGSSLLSNQKILEMIKQYRNIYGAVGIHPSDIKDLNPQTLGWITKVASHKKIVAIGEIGLDFHWEKTQEGRIRQQLGFIDQIKVARKLGLPIIVHSRDAAEVTYKLLSQERLMTRPGVIHCFSYSKELAEAYIRRGYYIGIGGVVTYKNSRVIKEVVEAIPIESIVLETDCPYLAPEPNRGTRNLSRNLYYVVRTTEYFSYGVLRTIFL